MSKTLEFKLYIIAEGLYEGKSKFPLWSNIREGDPLDLSIKLTSPGSGQGTYATLVHVYTPRTGYQGSYTLTAVEKYLQKMPHREVETINYAEIQNSPQNNKKVPGREQKIP